MRLKGKDYEQRLKEYSKSTIQLIMDCNYASKEVALKMSDITTDSELTEEEVVKKLKELLASAKTKTEQ